MSTKQNKNSLKKLLSIAGVATASVFLGFPALAQTSTNNGCGSYRGNATTGGGWYCAMDRVNPMPSNREASTMDRQSSTGANSSETGVNSNRGSNTMDSQSTESTDSGSRTIERQTTTSQSTTIEQRSNTTTYPATPVTPRSETTPSEQPQQPTTNTPSVNESTDQGVRALW
ncbi:MAG TPA: hypothetical protein DCE56_42330 [Cyanobacteria bacterium UBA8553]|nr:hypothetical protein [Cyanobacteria bacterium UBA8553]HAJ61558.1 hypothetical protein [Cyanobacteria bacterium UBA8543]